MSRFRGGNGSPFDPDLRRIARVLPRSTFGPRSLKLVRKLTNRQRRPAAGVEVHQLENCSVRVHLPPDAGAGPRPAFLWIHGGGFVIGNAWQDDALCREVSRRLGAVVAAVDYRLSPEFPFPIPLHDCHDALVWLARRSDVDADRVAIGGASAGGALAASLALLARERGEVRPVFQLLSYPLLDDRTVLRVDVDERYFRLWSTKTNRFGWECYLGVPGGSAGVDVLAAPARHPGLEGLPPAWIGVGTLDLLLDEARSYAERLRLAGVPCELVEVAGAFHGFDALQQTPPIVRRYRGAQIAALAGALAH